MVDLVTMMESNVFRTSSTLRLLPGKEETVVCVAFSEAFPIERVSSPVKLRVRHPPSVSLTFTSPPTISIGETFELECQASAYPANLTYVWTVDGKKLEDEKGKSLKLEHVDKEADGSIVTCQVIRIIKTIPTTSFCQNHHQSQAAFTKTVTNIAQVSNSVGRSWASLALSVRHGPTIVEQPQPVFARLDKNGN